MTNPGLLQILQLRMFDFAIHLRHRFFAAHRQHRMAEADQDADESDGVRQPRVAQPTERVVRIDVIVDRRGRGGR